MVSGEGDTSPSSAPRSSGLIPALAFIFVIILALAVVFALRQILPGATGTATPVVSPNPDATIVGKGKTATAAASTAPLVAKTPAANTPALASPSPRVATTPAGAATAIATRSLTLTGTAQAATAPAKATPVDIFPPAALGVPPVIYSFYDWRNTNFTTQNPQAGAIGSLAVFGWGSLHSGPGQYDWSAIDKYLAQAAAMTVTLQNGTVISKPVILEIVENESVQSSKQIAHVIGKSPLSARFVYQDYTPDFVKKQISSPLTRPITYTLADGSTGSLTSDGGSYLAEVGPATGCVTKTVGIVPKYDNATWQKYYREFVAALGARYDKDGQIVAVVFGPGIDQEYGQATKDFAGCALKAQVYKDMPEATYLDTVVKAGASNDLAHAWRSAFPTKPLYFQFTSSGKDRVDVLAGANLNPPLGLKQATLVYDNNNQWQSNNRGTLQIMSMYSTTAPIAWENAYSDSVLGTGAVAMQNRYFSILAGLSSFPDYMDFNGWVETMSAQAPWLLDFTRSYLGRSITTTNEVWVAMRGTEYITPTRGSVTQTGWIDDATYGLRVSSSAPLLRRAQLAAAPFSLPAAALDHPFALMARRTDSAQGVKTIGFAVDQRWPFWKQKPQSADPAGVWYDVTVKYLDHGRDSFSLVYKDLAGATQSYLINKSDSNTWLTSTVTLKNAYLAGGLADGADLILDAGTGDEVIHMVSIAGHASAPRDDNVLAPSVIDRGSWVALQMDAQATATALARLPGVLATPTLNKSLWLPLAEPQASAPVEAQSAPPGRPTIAPVYYAFYEWRNIDFGTLYPDLPAIGSQPVFGWHQVQTGPNQYNWTVIDDFLRGAATMTVTLVNGTVISKPIILEFTSNESEVYSSQIPHDPNYANSVDAYAARFAFHDYTPQFVKDLISAPLSKPITYALPSGQMATLTRDGGSYLIDVWPGTRSCITRTVGIVPKYNNATWQLYYKQFLTAVGQRYGNHPQIQAFVFGPGMDEEYGSNTKDFYECPLRDMNPLMSNTAYLQSIIKDGPNNDLLDAARAAFPNKPVMLQFTGDGKDFTNTIMQTNPYSYPVGLKQATLTNDMTNQWQNNGVGTIQIMQRYSDTTYIGWENAYPWAGAGPRGTQIRYQTLLAGLTTFPAYYDFMGYWWKDYELNDIDVLPWVQDHFGRTITNTQDVWVVLRDTDNWPPSGGGALSYAGWHDDFTYALHRLGPESNINNPVIKTAAMGAAPYNVPQTTLDHIFSYIDRRTDNASGNNIMGVYTDPRWGYYNQTSKAQDAANGAWYDVNIKYLDIGIDTLSFSYMGFDNITRTQTVRKTNTRAWVTTTLILDDAVWAHRLALGADLVLNSDPQNGGLDEIVHMFEIKGHHGGGPTPTPTWSPTPKPTRTQTSPPIPGSPTSTRTATPVGSWTPVPFQEMRVHAGGPLYVDSTGNTWVPDQPYDGSWGYYIGDLGGTYTSGVTVTGTADPLLYQTERWFANSGGSYIFTVPNGAYEVELRFAEIFGREPGKRIFSVQLNSVTVLDQLDIAATVGQNIALSRTFNTTVSDGQLIINFIPIKDSAKIASLRVTKLGAQNATPTATRTAGGPTATFTATAVPPTATATRTTTPLVVATATATLTATRTATPPPTIAASPTATATAVVPPTASPTVIVPPTPTTGPNLESQLDTLERRYASLLDLVNRLLQVLRLFGGIQ